MVHPPTLSHGQILGSRCHRAPKQPGRFVAAPRWSRPGLGDYRWASGSRAFAPPRPRAIVPGLGCLATPGDPGDAWRAGVSTAVLWSGPTGVGGQRPSPQVKKPGHPSLARWERGAPQGGERRRRAGGDRGVGFHTGEMRKGPACAPTQPSGCRRSVGGGGRREGAGVAARLCIRSVARSREGAVQSSQRASASLRWGPRRGALVARAAGRGRKAPGQGT